MTPASKKCRKGRGRPHGTGLNDDLDLAKIAGMIVQTPSLRPTTAIKRVLGAEGDPSTIRRLQVKWKATGTEWLAKAKAGRDNAVVPVPSSAGGVSAKNLGQLAAMNGAMRAALGISSPLSEALHGRTLNVTRLAAQSAVARAAFGDHDSHTMRIMREMYNSPTMRIMREIHDSPTMRAAREMQKTLRLIQGGFGD